MAGPAATSVWGLGCGLRGARAGVLASGGVLCAKEGAYGGPSSHHCVWRRACDPLPQGPCRTPTCMHASAISLLVRRTGNHAGHTRAPVSVPLRQQLPYNPRPAAPGTHVEHPLVGARH